MYHEPTGEYQLNEWRSTRHATAGASTTHVLNLFNKVPGVYGVILGIVQSPYMIVQMSYTKIAM